MTQTQLTIRLPAAIILFFAVWEGCARVDDTWTDGAPLLGRYDQSVLMTADEFGIAGRPGAHYAKWKMNSLGFRGPELQWNREKILCIGASETFGLYEPEGMEFPRQLERELNQRAGSDRYQVVNAGLPGQSLSSFARRAVKVTDEVRPSLAVVYPSLAIYIDPPPERFIPGSSTDRPGFQLRIAGRLTALLSRHIPEAVQTAGRRLLIFAETRHEDVVDRLPEANVERFHRDLDKLIESLESRHVKPLLVTHATRFGANATPGDRPLLTAWRALHPRLREDGFLDMELRLNNVIRSEARERNLVLVDAARLLHGADNFVEFVHFTPRGAAALARAIADKIDRNAIAQNSTD